MQIKAMPKERIGPMPSTEPTDIEGLRHEHGIKKAWQCELGRGGAVWFWRWATLTDPARTRYGGAVLYRVYRDEQGRLHMILGPNERFIPSDDERHTWLYYRSSGKMYDRAIIDLEEETDG